MLANLKAVLREEAPSITTLSIDTVFET
jgi:hypothetical protein